MEVAAALHPHRAAAAQLSGPAALTDGERCPQERRKVTGLSRTRADVAELNQAARAGRRERGERKRGQIIRTERGAREFAAGDRLYFLCNELARGGIAVGIVGVIGRVAARIGLFTQKSLSVLHTLESGDEREVLHVASDECQSFGQRRPCDPAVIVADVPTGALEETGGA